MPNVPVSCRIPRNRFTYGILIISAVANAQSRAKEIRADNPAIWGNAQLTRVFSLGRVDGPPEYAIGEVAAFAARRDGVFFQYDSKDHQIRAYDSTGKFLRRIGRRGDGPGEYQQVMGLALLGDSLLAVWDARWKRLSYFAIDGKLISSRTLASVPGTFAKAAFGMDAQGVYYFRQLDPKRRQVNGELGSSYVRLSNGLTTRPAIHVPHENAPSGSFRRRTLDGYRWNFYPMTLTALYPPGGIVYGRNDEFAITVTDPDGNDALVIRRSYTPVPVRSDEKREWDAIGREVARMQPTPGSRIITGPPFVARPTPSTKPVFRSLYADYDGRIWVERYVEAVKGEDALDPPLGNVRMTWREPTIFDVLARDGTYLGRLQFPVGATILAARGYFAWLLEVGDDGEQLIRGYRVSPKQ